MEELTMFQYILKYIKKNKELNLGKAFKATFIFLEQQYNQKKIDALRILGDMEIIKGGNTLDPAAKDDELDQTANENVQREWQQSIEDSLLDNHIELKIDPEEFHREYSR
ncbi:MAG: hypothetical protein JSR33_11100 [Proteobacteria bacterium]|nr:hypothetical protein [Pseudomonadota bacterium]